MLKCKIKCVPTKSLVSSSVFFLTSLCVATQLVTDLIKKSFESCALSLPIDGSADDVIHCFKEGEPCRQGREVLRSQLSILKKPDTNPFEVSDSDVEDASDPHLWIDDDQEGDDQDVDVLF